MDKKEKEHKKELGKDTKKSRNKFIALGVLVAIIISTYLVLQAMDNTSANGVPLVDGIECDTVEYGIFHIHAHLDVLVDGKPYTIPSQVGINVNNNCLYWLHTHDASGVIHIESPKTRTFTLGEFLDIWKATGSVKPPTGAVNIFVNGKASGSDPNSITLNAHDEIVVAYGTLPSFIQPFYQFPQGL